MSVEEKEYIEDKTTQGWTPDVIVGRGELSISCSVRTLYRRFQNGEFDRNKLPKQGKRKPNGYQERRGKQAFKRNIAERKKDYTAFENEFGHLEGDTIVGVHHKSAVITFVERFSKVIIALKPKGRRAIDIDIYFADPGTSSQRGLNEHSNGLLRKDGLPKEIIFLESH